MKPINVLALCDGMSCGQIALTELGVPINQYYASEIDKFAIQQTQHNFPKTIQLGDIENWRTWDIDFKSIDLILAGTPCQGFSFAGKQLAFDDPRSRLFFVFVDILNHIRKLNPDVKFLLENVNMKKSHLEVISRYTGVFPVRINSTLVSAQNRDRWYWTNVKTKEVGLFGEIYSDIPQPKDRGILLRDILENDVAEKYYIKNPKIGFEGISINGKSNTLRTGGGLSQSDKHNCDIIKIDKQGNPKKSQDKASCFTAGAHSGGNHSDMDLIACLTPKRTEYGKQIRKAYESGELKEQRKNISSLEPRSDDKTNTLTSVQKDNLILQLGRGFNKGGLHKDKTPTLTKNSCEQNNLGLAYTLSGGKWDKTHESNRRVYSPDGKMQTLQTMGGGNQHPKTLVDYRIRRLTPTECARLQTIPDWYKWIVSDTQIYKQCGNGWTIEVIKHILYQWDLVNELVLTYLEKK